MRSETLVAPPWTLTGYGYLVLYKLPPSICEQYTGDGTFKGGFSGLIIANYQDSPVGPYGELIFIPGIVQYTHTRGYTVSKIYVSTMASVVNGIEHWALPKQPANFQFTQLDNNTERITVSPGEDTPFVDMIFQTGGIPIPINGALLPKVHQERDNKAYITRLKSSGWGKLAKIKQAHFNDTHYPDLANFNPLITLKVTQFTMEFPVPVIKT